MLRVNYDVDNCCYKEDVTQLDEMAIVKARKVVLEYIKKGILTNHGFDDDTWVLDNQNQIRTLAFPKETDALNKYCAKTFKFTGRRFITLAKTYIVLNFGTSSAFLQVMVAEIKNFSEYLIEKTTLEALKVNGANKLVDFIALLPENPNLDEVREELEAYAKDSYQGTLGEQRTLAQFRSYLKFGDLLDKYWASAINEEKIHFFPIWFWWKVSTLIPLRPTELTLTPRNCITKDGKLIVRRTKLKSRKLSSEYRLDLDYTKYFYTVPSEITDVARWYIEKTATRYLSDVDVLFSLDESGIDQEKRLNGHFTYNDMDRLLKKFYDEVVVSRQHYNVVDFIDSNICELQENEIEEINLGDTRHLAMVAIFITTKNPEICRELAEHSDINISSHYFTNMQNFIKAISFERVKTQNTIYSPHNPSMSLTSNVYKMPLIDGGFCLSKNVTKGDYSDCKNAVDKDGHLFICSKCQYYISANSKTVFNVQNLSKNKVSDADFKESFNFLLHTINQVRRGFGCDEDIQSAFLKMQASAMQYENTLVKQYAMEGYYGQTFETHV